MTSLNVISHVSTGLAGKQSGMSESCTWLRDRLLWATLCADRSPWAQPGVALSNKDEGWQTQRREGNQTLPGSLSVNAPCIMYLFYLCNFNAAVLFLSLVSDGIVVPGTVVIHQFSIPLRYTCLNTGKKSIWILDFPVWEHAISPWCQGTVPGRYPWRLEHGLPAFGGSRSTARHSPSAGMNTGAFTNTNHTSELTWTHSRSSVLDHFRMRFSVIDP